MSNPSADLIITPLHPEDLPLVVQLEEESSLSSWGVAGYERELLNPHALLLAARKPDLAGFFSGRAIVDEFELLSIVVRQDFRQLGVGSVLLATSLQEMKKRGLVRCWLEVRSSNLAAIKLYEKFGFHTVGRRRNYYKSPPDDALLMVREK